MTSRRLGFFTLAILFIISFISKDECILGVKEGLETAFHTVIPCLFPFIFLSSLMVKYAPAKGVGFLSLVAGLFCGYPIGAKCVADNYASGRISKRDAENLLFSVNNAGPQMVILLCGEGVFGSEKAGLFFFCGEIFFASVFFFLTPKITETKGTEKSVRFSESVVSSAENAVFSSLNIASFIVIFSFIEKVFFSFLGIKNEKAIFLLSILLEVTGGFGKAVKMPRAFSLPVCLFGIGWGGVSVLFQTLGIVKKAGLSAKNLILGKITMGISLAIYGLFSYKIL